MTEQSLRERSAWRPTVSRAPAGLSGSTAWLGAVGLSCLSLACARTSEERTLAIARLLDEARSFQAEQYAPEAFARAERLLSRTRAELDAQRDKPWFASRRRTRQLLSESEAAAALVRAEAAAAVVRARQQATREVVVAHAAFDQASEAYWRSPRGKDTRADVERMRADLDALLRRLNEAEVALESGEFLLAGRLAGEVSQRAGAVAATIDRATAYRIRDPQARAFSPASGPDAPYPRSPAPVARLPRASPRPPAAAPAGRRAG